MRKVMQQTVMQNRYLSSKSTHKLIEKNIWQMVACSMIIKIIYNPKETIMSNQMIYNVESIHVKWSEQNMAKIRVTMLSKVRWSVNINSISMSRTNNNNEAREKSPQSESSIKINKHHNQHVNVPSKNKHPSMHPMISRTLNVQSRNRYPLIDSSNATFASS